MKEVSSTPRKTYAGICIVIKKHRKLVHISLWTEQTNIQLRLLHDKVTTMILGSIKRLFDITRTAQALDLQPCINNYSNMILEVKKSLLGLRDMTSRPNEHAFLYPRYSAIIKNKTGHQLLFVNQIIYTQSVHSISIVFPYTCHVFL